MKRTIKGIGIGNDARNEYDKNKIKIIFLFVLKFISSFISGKIL